MEKRSERREELRHRAAVVREILDLFPESTIQTSVAPQSTASQSTTRRRDDAEESASGACVFLVQLANAEQALRLEVAEDWLLDNSEAAIREKLDAFDVLGKLRTCGGVPVKVNHETCP